MANNTSISNLSEVEEVNAGDFFIIDTPNGTQKIDFGNVLIPLDNATFNTTISAHATDITTNRTEIQTLTAALYDGGDTTLAVGSLSTQSLTAGAFNLTGDSLVLSESNATLPATTCTSLSSPSVSAINTAKVWLNYNHTTPAVRSSFGVSSVDDNATGQYTVNFSTAFSNDDYAVAGLTNGSNTDANSTYPTYIFNETLMVAGSCKITNQHYDGTELDSRITTLIFFGN